MSSVADFIEMSEREIPIRQYGPFRMSYPQKGVSYLALTNKRLIVFAQNRSAAKEGRISLAAEINIHDVKGIESKTLGAAYLPGIIAGLIFFAVSAYLYFRPYSSAYAAIERITQSLFPPYILPLFIGVMLIIIPAIFSRGRFEFRVNEIPGENNTSLLSKGIIFHDSRKISEITGDIGAAVIKIQENNRESEKSGDTMAPDAYPTPFPAKIPDITDTHKKTVDDDYITDTDELNTTTGYQPEKETESSGSTDFGDSGDEMEDDYSESLEYLEEKSSQKDDYLF